MSGAGLPAGAWLPNVWLRPGFPQGQVIPGVNTRCLGVVKKPLSRLELETSPLPRSALPLSYKGMCGWAGLDLNQRRQSQRIYSPPPLTTRAPTRTQDGTLPAHAHRSGATPLLAWGSQAVCTDQLLQHRQHFMTRHAFFPHLKKQLVPRSSLYVLAKHSQMASAFCEQRQLSNWWSFPKKA